ncbi:hypothetical protein KQI84_01935 [bacterium]|nr:hypothetical protein [bacterium]
MHALLTVSHIIHLIGAAVLVGGVFFFRVILLKYAAREGGLDDQLKDRIAGRWIHLAWMIIAIMIATGIFQFTQVYKDFTSVSHMLFGIKMLALVGILAVLGLLSVAKAGKWAQRKSALLTINVLLGLLMLLLSAWLIKTH